MNLIEMLKQNKPFQELPLDHQDLYLHLAHIFEQDDAYLFMDPKQLTEETSSSSIEGWKQFLRLEPVKNYIKQEVAEHTEIAFRKGLLSSATQAEHGSIQHIKEVNDLKGVYEKQDSHKVIILHQVQRPQIKEVTK